MNGSRAKMLRKLIPQMATPAIPQQAKASLKKFGKLRFKLDEYRHKKKALYRAWNELPRSHRGAMVKALLATNDPAVLLDY
jgi:hypothetical protein